MQEEDNHFTSMPVLKVLAHMSLLISRRKTFDPDIFTIIYLKQKVRMTCY